MSTAGELPLGRRVGKSEAAFRTISEVADELDVPQHVLRFWESKFPQVKPLKRGGGRRYYRPEDVALLRRIRDLLYSEGYTIKGVQKLLREGGPRDVSATGKPQPELGLPMDDDPPEDEDDVPPQMADGKQGDGDGDDYELADPPVDMAGEPVGIGGDRPLAPEVRRALAGILDELEQLRSLLQPR